MSGDDKTYGELLANFNLLCEIVRQPGKESELSVDLSKLDERVNRTIPDTLKDNAPENFYALYSDFQSEYERFCDFIRYDKLIGKKVVALGGGFSSGKSSFMNALLEEEREYRLPMGIDPSTSVPTYIVSGEHDIIGINEFHARVRVPPGSFHKIAHGFGALEDMDGGRISDAVSLGHVLKKIFFSTPKNPYGHLAFLDTPGYSNPDSEDCLSRTDERIAREQLNASDFILWFVPSDAGTIPENDIKFLKTLDPGIPKLIVVSKADLVTTLDELKDIIEQVKHVCMLKGIGDKFLGVHAFSRRREVGEFLASEKREIKKQIKKWDSEADKAKKKGEAEGFAYNFKRFFSDCRRFYEERIEEEEHNLDRLHKSMTSLWREDIAKEIWSPLEEMVDDAKDSVRELKGVKEGLKAQETAFFNEINRISSQLGIEIPGWEEIARLKDKAQSPLQMIEDYCEEKGIKADPSIQGLLKKTFSGIEPVINRRAGGSEYRDELMGVIAEHLDLAPEDIHIHDCLLAAEEYKALIEGI